MNLLPYPRAWPALLLGLSLAGHGVSAASSTTLDTIEVCSALYAEFPEQVFWDPLGPNGMETIANASVYVTANTEYWNAKSSSNRATCMFSPSDAEQVSFAVRQLNAHPSAPFAVKCGGHNPNLGFSSVEDGVLIAFRPNSQYAVPSADGTTVDVGAGAKWEDVYAEMGKLNKAVVGGRLGDVGVMGLTLGGGLSYLSSQYGLACDNVVNFECVLADGSIVNANATSHPDLFAALHGGGNQYAIVAKMTLKTYDVGVAGRVWGGTRIYGGAQHAAVLSAVASFTAGNVDPKAALIPTFNFVGALGLDVPAIIVFFFYDGDAAPAGVFDELDAVPHLIDATRTQTYYDLTQEALAGKLQGFRVQIRTNTFPNMPVKEMGAFLSEHFEMVSAAASKEVLHDLLDLELLTFAVQPVSHMIAQASKDSGGDALGLDPANGDRIWVEYDLEWGSSACDDSCPQYLEEVTDSLHAMHEEKYAGVYPTNYKSGNLSWISYNPLFMNDAMYDQPVLQGYGPETYNRLKSTHEKYDPNGFFSTRLDGFKFTT